MTELPSIRDLLLRFYTIKSSYVEKTTLDRYSQTFQDLDNVLGLDRSIITSEDAYAYLASIVRRKNLSPDTKKRRIQILIAAYDWLISENYLVINPWRGLDKKIQNPKPSIKVFSEADRDKIISYFHGSKPHYAGFVEFLFSTGCRPGEAIALSWKKVNWENSTILIDCQIGTGKELKPPKNGKSRYLKLNTRIMRLLASQKEVVNSSHNIIFPNNLGDYIHEKNFCKVHWRKCQETLGIEYLPLHHTRHTFVTMCIAKGLNPVTIAQFTGHRVKVLFDFYAGLWEQPSIPEF